MSGICSRHQHHEPECHICCAVPAAAKVRGIVTRLRDYEGCHDGDIDEAADMLEFFFCRMQMHSPKMNGQHSYRFRSGWPMTHCVGPSEESAVKAAMREVERARGEALQ